MWPRLVVHIVIFIDIVYLLVAFELAISSSSRNVAPKHNYLNVTRCHLSTEAVVIYWYVR